MPATGPGAASVRARVRARRTATRSIGEQPRPARRRWRPSPWRRRPSRPRSPARAPRFRLPRTPRCPSIPKRPGGRTSQARSAPYPARAPQQAVERQSHRVPDQGQEQDTARNPPVAQPPDAGPGKRRNHSRGSSRASARPTIRINTPSTTSGGSATRAAAPGPWPRLY